MGVRKDVGEVVGPPANGLVKPPVVAPPVVMPPVVAPKVVVVGPPVGPAVVHGLVVAPPVVIKTKVVGLEPPVVRVIVVGPTNPVVTRFIVVFQKVVGPIRLVVPVVTVFRIHVVAVVAVLRQAVSGNFQVQGMLRTNPMLARSGAAFAQHLLVVVVVVVFHLQGKAPAKGN